MAPPVFFSFIIATFATMVLVPPLGRVAQWLHAVDLPAPRKIHDAPVPRLGGVAMAIGAMLPPLVWATLDAQMIGVLCGIAIILIFGIWDDLKNIGYQLKFLGQILAVLIVVLYGGVVIRYVPFLGLSPLADSMAIPLTVFALIGVTNAINLADGLDGLAAGITLLSLAVIAVLAYAANDNGLLLTTAAVGGSIVGFLRFNTYPARVFMGDSGSQFLGFSAGVLVVVLTQKSSTALSPVLPLVILGLPILDTLMVMTERLREGHSPFLPDKKHIHHRLLALGFHHYEAVFIIYFVQALLVVAAYALRYESDWLILSLYGAFCVSLIALLKAAGARGWRVNRSRRESASPSVPWWLAWVRKDQRILKTAFCLALVAIPCYFFAGAFFVDRVPKDIGALACGLLIVLLMLFVRHRHRPFSVVERACAYIAGACVVYLVHVAPGALTHFDMGRDILFAIMTVAVVIGFRFSKERFRLTPMDFLVVLVALVVPNLPVVELHAQHVGASVAMLIVLLYCIELVLNNIWRQWDVMRLTTCCTLAILGLRGVVGTAG